MSQDHIKWDPYQRSLRYVVTNVVPKLGEQFQKDTGKKVISVKFIHDETKKGEEQFQSIAIFGTIVFEYESKDSRTESKRVIIKMQIGDERSLKWSNGGVQFFNEVVLYSDFLPYFSKVVSDIQNIFPKLAYGYVSDCGQRLEDIIILEDLIKEGYRLATSKSKLSTSHILLALESLGKFHAASYIMKSIDKETFLQKMNSLKNVRGWVTDTKDDHQKFLAKNGERGLWHLETMPAYKGKLDRIRNFLANIGDSLPQIYETNERSVLIHGDFCRNNMFFKYDNNEEPISVKFFDMATVVYASPALDISFFLYLNTVQEQRVKDWDLMIRTYYDSLKRTCQSYAESSKANIVIPTFEEILDEFKLKSMEGYLACAFFLPMMMQKVPEDRSTWGKLSEEELIQHRLRTSGEEGTKAVGEILIHMIDHGFM